MLDKVIVLSCRKQAYLIFTNRVPFGISSDIDVVPLLMWFLGFPNAKFIIANDGETITGIELRKDCGDEITVKLVIGDVA